MLRIAEIFQSVQGEGLLTGVDSVFLRTSGCNLRCVWCDTDYASWQPEGPVRHSQCVIDEVSEYEVEHIVITGGEPMLPRDIVPVTQGLKSRGHHITIETAGTIDRDVDCDLMSISPKLANSTPINDRRDPTGKWQRMHEQSRDRIEIVQRFVERYAYQFKFVCGTPADVDDASTYIARLQGIDPARVLLMPEGTDTETLNSRLAWLEPLAAERGFGIAKRLHIELFGNTRGS